jgi:CRISPR-associated protein Cas1
MRSDRFIEIASSPARLSLRTGLIVVTRENQPEVTVPVGELSCVVLAHPQAGITQPAMAALMAAGCPIIICDGHLLPTGMMLPLASNTLQTQRMLAQAAAPRPVAKRLWQQVVRAKVRSQAAVLQGLHGDDGGLAALAETVRSGDPMNIEAQAASRYWPLLFRDPDFRRRFDAPDQNRLLNYGYAVLRAAVARAICASGLHPTIGIHHHHRENPFCLADDLMEPYRPLVDGEVYKIAGEMGKDVPLSSAVKARLIELLDLRIDSSGPGSPLRTVSDHIADTAFSVADAFISVEGRDAASVRIFYPKGLLTW